MLVDLVFSQIYVLYEDCEENLLVYIHIEINWGISKM